MFQLHYFLFIISVVVKVFAVPPAVCRAEFRWDDCGKPAKPVMYYWKQGSRCEIGYWRGCLPNPNMFADEYECINTCVFVDRPAPRMETEEPEPETTTEHENSTITNGTTLTSGDNTTVTENVTTNGTGNGSSSQPDESSQITTTTDNSSDPSTHDSSNKNDTTE